MRLCLALAWLLCLPPLFSGQETVRKPGSEQGRFEIYVDGKQIGEEKFSIRESPDSCHSESVVTFKTPGREEHSVRLETQLEMDAQYMPRAYKVKSSVDGQSRVIEGTFSPGQANFKYAVQGTPRQSGLLLDDYYVVLDANVFHHFIFAGRLVEFDAADIIQSLDVVIPQELDYGVLNIRDNGLEKTSVRGKKMELHHLKVDSGSVQMDLWVDAQHLLHKIALPARKIEVLRKP